jgi:hypothetical protein
LLWTKPNLVTEWWVGYIWLFLNILSFIKNAMVICKTVHIQTTYILFNRSGLNAAFYMCQLSQEKLVQPFKCYQIILLSLTCQMIDCTGQYVRVLLLNGLIRLSIVITILLSNARQFCSSRGEWIKTVKCNINRILT